MLNASPSPAAGCAIAESAAAQGGRSAARGPGSRWCRLLDRLRTQWEFGVTGYADLLWAASALAAILIGLVPPAEPAHLAAAWLCATVAGLSKPEGFITACNDPLVSCRALYFVSGDAPHRAAAEGRGVRRTVGIVLGSLGREGGPLCRRHGFAGLSGRLREVRKYRKRFCRDVSASPSHIRSARDQPRGCGAICMFCRWPSGSR